MCALSASEAGCGRCLRVRRRRCPSLPVRERGCAESCFLGSEKLRSKRHLRHALRLQTEAIARYDQTLIQAINSVAINNGVLDQYSYSNVPTCTRVLLQYRSSVLVLICGMLLTDKNIPYASNNASLWVIESYCQTARNSLLFTLWSCCYRRSGKYLWRSWAAWRHGSPSWAQNHWQCLVEALRTTGVSDTHREYCAYVLWRLANVPSLNQLAFMYSYSTYYGWSSVVRLPVGPRSQRTGKGVALITISTKNRTGSPPYGQSANKVYWTMIYVLGNNALRL